MRTATAAEIETARAAAIAKFADPERKIRETVTKLARVTLGAPAGGPDGCQVLAVPLSLESFIAHSDARDRDLGTAQQNLWADRVVWPAIDEALVISSKWPGAINEYETELYEHAGMVGKRECEPISLSDLPAGLAKDAAAPFVAAGAWLYRRGDAAIVFRGPTADVFHAYRAKVRELTASGAGTLRTLLDFARGTILWTSHGDFDGTLQRFPFVAADFLPEWQKAGGVGVDSKSDLV